jgi:hypothetical protein
MSLDEGTHRGADVGVQVTAAQPDHTGAPSVIKQTDPAIQSL